MGILHLLHPLRALFAAAFLLSLAAAPARAVSVPVFWDDPIFGGFGVSQATAQAANAAGIPLIQVPSVEFNFPDPDPAKIAIAHPPFLSNVVIPPPPGTLPATGTANWTGTNNSGLNQPGAQLYNLYLVFAKPLPNNEFTVGGVPHPIDYDPSEVGLQLSSGEAGIADWVILQLPSNPLVPTSDPVYYPAVSLGTLGAGAATPFELFYTLKNPQTFGDPNTLDLALGIPAWNLYFASTVVPEPSSALLLLIGLGALAAVRRERP